MAVPVVVLAMELEDRGGVLIRAIVGDLGRSRGRSQGEGEVYLGRFGRRDIFFVFGKEGGGRVIFVGLASAKW